MNRIEFGIASLINIFSFEIEIFTGGILSTFFLFIFPDDFYLTSCLPTGSVWHLLLNSIFLGFVSAELLLSLIMSYLFNPDNSELFVIMQPAVSAISNMIYFSFSPHTDSSAAMYMLTMLHCSAYQLFYFIVYLFRH